MKSQILTDHVPWNSHTGNELEMLAGTGPQCGSSTEMYIADFICVPVDGSRLLALCSTLL